MAKIALVIVLISMIMIFSVQSVVGDGVAATTNVNRAVGSVQVASGPAKDGANGKSPSWTDWTKKKISGIETNIEKFFSTSSSPGSAPAAKPATATATATANKV